MYTPFLCYRLVVYLGIYLNGGSSLVILGSYKLSQLRAVLLSNQNFTPSIFSFDCNATLIVSIS
ncbi:hypothetical protein P5673_018945 [Acropora cervicornis]|uniref:Uncharacterized protein n=1 Tax=Acropora cervicornis TaxID=6130 RepID=A0AAD9V2E6_ACRCE|nr:hypothetical protein P5673_018945 [Acropora cervicornis]